MFHYSVCQSTYFTILKPALLYLHPQCQWPSCIIVLVCPLISSGGMQVWDLFLMSQFCLFWCRSNSVDTLVMTNKLNYPQGPFFLWNQFKSLKVRILESAVRVKWGRLMRPQSDWWRNSHGKQKHWLWVFRVSEEESHSQISPTLKVAPDWLSYENSLQIRGVSLNFRTYVFGPKVIQKAFSTKSRS